MMDMPRSVRLRLLTVLAAALAVPPGCGGPSPQIYVLGTAVADAPATASQMNTPTVEVRPAKVPDYLDTTGIVTRGAGGLIVLSQSGRWGERFSVGLTRAVAAALTRKLPDLAVTMSARWSEPRWQVGIELEAFDVQPAGSSSLAATWTVLEVQHRRKLAEERVVLTANGTYRTDAEVVVVMDRQVNELAERIAVSLAPIAGVSPRGGRSIPGGPSQTTASAIRGGHP
jgi:uncharacterized lipoprotein YmbA